MGDYTDFQCRQNSTPSPRESVTDLTMPFYRATLSLGESDAGGSRFTTENKSAGQFMLAFGVLNNFP